MQHEALRVRLRQVEIRILDRRLAEHPHAAPAAAQRVGVVERVAGLVPQDLQAPLGRAAFDLQHLRCLEPHQPRMRQIERDGDAGDAVRREPLGRQPVVRPEGQAARGEILVEFVDARLEPAALDA